MQLDLKSPEPVTTQPVASSTKRTSTRAMNQRPQLTSLITLISVLASLMEPEAVVALANGAPNLDSDTLVQLLNESRIPQ